MYSFLEPLAHPTGICGILAVPGVRAYVREREREREREICCYRTPSPRNQATCRGRQVIKQTTTGNWDGNLLDAVVGCTLSGLSRLCRLSTSWLLDRFCRAVAPASPHPSHPIPYPIPSHLRCDGISVKSNCQIPRNQTSHLHLHFSGLA